MYGKRWNGEERDYYYRNGALRYVQEYSNGKKSGKRIEYYRNGKIKFEGEI